MVYPFCKQCSTNQTMRSTASNLGLYICLGCIKLLLRFSYFSCRNKDSAMTLLVIRPIPHIKEATKIGISRSGSIAFCINNVFLFYTTFICQVNKQRCVAFYHKHWQQLGVLLSLSHHQIVSSPEPKAQGDLIVYQSSRRLSVNLSVCLWTFSYSNISATSGPIVTKFYLNHHLGGGNAALGFGPDRIGTLVSLATNSSHRVIMGKML